MASIPSLGDRQGRGRRLVLDPDATEARLELLEDRVGEDAFQLLGSRTRQVGSVPDVASRLAGVLLGDPTRLLHGGGLPAEAIGEGREHEVRHVLLHLLDLGLLLRMLGEQRADPVLAEADVTSLVCDRARERLGELRVLPRGSPRASSRRR